MPFVIEHAPSAASVHRAGYLGGYAQFRARQEELALKAAALAQQDMQQQRAIAAQQQSQMFGAQQNAVERNFRGAMAVGEWGADREARLADMKAMRGFEVEDRDLRMKMAAEAEAADMERAGMIDARAREAGMMDDLRMLDAEIADSMKPYHTGEAILEAGTQKALTEIRNQRRAVMSSEELSDAERRQQLLALGQKELSTIASNPPPLPGEAPKSMAQVWGENTAEVMLPWGEKAVVEVGQRNGVSSGKVLARESDRKIEAGVVPFNQWVADHVKDTVEEEGRLGVTKRPKTDEELQNDWRREMRLRQMNPQLEGAAPPITNASAPQQPQQAPPPPVPPPAQQPVPGTLTLDPRSTPGNEQFNFTDREGMTFQVTPIEGLADPAWSSLPVGGTAVMNSEVDAALIQKGEQGQPILIDRIRHDEFAQEQVPQQQAAAPRVFRRPPPIGELPPGSPPPPPIPHIPNNKEGEALLTKLRNESLTGVVVYIDAGTGKVKVLYPK